METIICNLIIFPAFVVKSVIIFPSPFFNVFAYIVFSF